MRFEYRPLPAIWPFGQRTSPRVTSKFRAPYARTLELLERELWYLEAYDLVLEAGYTRGDIRADGQPRANAKLNDPALVLSFASMHGPLRYGCDRFHDHQDNLRAIALTLEHLRACDRYGVTRRGEQYQGWAQLAESAESREEAEAFIRQQGRGARTPDLLAAYRAAARRLHPDTAPAGTDPELWDRLQRARVTVGL